MIYRYLIVLLLVCAPHCEVAGFLDVQRVGYGDARSYSSYAVCSLFRGPDTPAPGNVPHRETCGLTLLAHNETTLLVQTNACGPGTGTQGVNGEQKHMDTQLPTTHGRDFIFVELSHGARVRSRLPGVHIGAGRYTFPAWRCTHPGTWNATFLLWATARPPLLGSHPTFNALTQVHYLFQLYDFVATPKRVVLQVQLEMTSAPGTCRLASARDTGAGGESAAGAPPESPPPRRPLCTAPAKGEWAAIAAGAVECPPHVCVGPLQPLLYGSEDNVAIDFHDVYRPYDCNHRIFTADEAAACLAGKQLALIGDSRMVGVAGYIGRYLPNVSHALFNIMPFRVGIRALMPSAYDTFLPPGGLLHVLSHYDIVILSSELHDLADFELPATNYTRHYGFEPGPYAYASAATLGLHRHYHSHHHDARAGSGLEGAPPPPLSGNYAGDGGAPDCAPKDAAAAQRVKYRPVAQYLEALRDFVSYYLDVRQQLAASGALRAARVFWYYTGYRPAGTPQCLPNQLERMLCLQHLELAEVARAGWEPLDFATMLQDGPPEWFSDDVHVVGSRSTKKRTSSGVEMMEVQVLLNTLCNAPDSDGAGGEGDRGAAD